MYVFAIRFFNRDSVRSIACGIVLGVIGVAFLLVPFSSANPVSDERGNKEFWLKKYGELPGNPETERVKMIFQALISTGDRKIGLDPVLHIIDFEGKPWAQALQDGSVIVTKNALTYCFEGQEKERGNARMAFILGHEIAHLQAGDFWHYAFFQAAEAEKNNSPDGKVLEEIQDIVVNSENLIIKELRADQLGAVNASMAGFQVAGLLQGEQNFFLETARAMHIRSNASYPTPEQRTVATMSRLKEVVETLPLFTLGTAAYYAGKYRETITLLEAFKAYYPGKVVLNNLGGAYLRLALKYYLLTRDQGSFPFKLSFTISPFSSSQRLNVSRGSVSKSEKYFKRYLALALNNLKKSVQSDPVFGEAKNNLGCAYLLEGNFYEAIGQFNRALKQSPGFWEAYNNRGVAYHYLGNELGTPLNDKAYDSFSQAAFYSKKSLIPANNISILSERIGVTGNLKSKPEFKTRPLSANFLPSLENLELKEKLINKTGLKPGAEVYVNKLIEKKWNLLLDRSGTRIISNQEGTISLMVKNGRVKIVSLSPAAYFRPDAAYVSDFNSLHFNSLPNPDQKAATAAGEVWIYEEGIEVFTNKESVVSIFYY